MYLRPFEVGGHVGSVKELPNSGLNINFMLSRTSILRRCWSSYGQYRGDDKLNYDFQSSLKRWLNKTTGQISDITATREMFVLPISWWFEDCSAGDVSTAECKGRLWRWLLTERVFIGMTDWQTHARAVSKYWSLSSMLFFVIESYTRQLLRQQVFKFNIFIVFRLCVL